MTASTAQEELVTRVTQDAPAELLLTTDLPCPCGYNLRGLARDSRCPECGASVADALRWHAHPLGAPAALRRMTLGLTIVLAAYVAWVVVLGLCAASPSADRPAFWLTAVSGPKAFIGPAMIVIEGSESVMPFLLPLTHALHLVGLWLLTAPRRAGCASALRRPGLALRWTAILCCVAAYASYRLWNLLNPHMLGWAGLTDAIVGVLWGWFLIGLGRALPATWLRVGGWTMAVGSALAGGSFAAALILPDALRGHWETLLWSSLTAWAAIGAACTVLLALAWRRLRRERANAEATPL